VSADLEMAMSRADPSISIVIPVHDAEAHLRECLDSCLCQVGADVEIVAVDDASTDGSGRILRECEKADSRVRVVTFDENRGTHQARRSGVEAARGDYVLCLDSDDRLSSADVCAKLSARAGAVPSDLILFGARGFCTEARVMAHADRLIAPFDAKVATSDADEIDVRRYQEELFVEKTRAWLPAGKLFRRGALLDAFRTLPVGYCCLIEDVLMLSAVLARSPRISSSSTVGYDYRIGSGISWALPSSKESRLRLLRSAALFSHCFAPGAGLVDFAYSRSLYEQVWLPIVHRSLTGCGTRCMGDLLGETLSAFASDVWRGRVMEAAFAVEGEKFRERVEKAEAARRGKCRWRMAFLALALANALALALYLVFLTCSRCDRSRLPSSPCRESRTEGYAIIRTDAYGVVSVCGYDEFFESITA